MSQQIVAYLYKVTLLSNTKLDTYKRLDESQKSLSERKQYPKDYMLFNSIYLFMI